MEQRKCETISVVRQKHSKQLLWANLYGKKDKNFFKNWTDKCSSAFASICQIFKFISILCIFILNFQKIETMITEVVPSEVFLFYQPTLLHQHFIKNSNNFWKFIFHFHEMIFMFVKVNNFGSLWSPLDEIHFGKHNFHFF